MTTTVNGRAHEAPADLTLLTWLREVLDLTSVKEGCTDGSCGTCLVRVDGRTVKACTRAASTVAGKHVTTAEGLAERERAAIVSAFEQEGAVQCGFCMPGFAMTTTALLDANPDPTRDEVVRALRSNVCRCTGYRMVEDAVLRTGRILRGEEEVAAAPERISMSDRAPRPDAAAEGARHRPLHRRHPAGGDGARHRAALGVPAGGGRGPRRQPRSRAPRLPRGAHRRRRAGERHRPPRRRLGRARGGGRHHPLRRRRPGARRVRPRTQPGRGRRADRRQVHRARAGHQPAAGAGARGATAAPGRQRADPRGGRPRRRAGRPGRVRLRRLQHLPHAVAGARLHGAGVRRGPAVGRRRGRGVHLRAVGLRRAARDRADARPAAREGARALDARRRRLRRQGGHERAAPRGAGGLAHRAAGEGQVLPRREPRLPRQAAPDGPRDDPGLRRRRPAHRARGPDRRGHRRLRVARRARPAARGDARRRPVQLPELPLRGPGGLHEQPGVGCLPRVRGGPERVRPGEQHHPARREGRHRPLGVPLPQRDPARPGAAQRADRRRRHRARRVPRGPQARLRRRPPRRAGGGVQEQRSRDGRARHRACPDLRRAGRRARAHLGRRHGPGRLPDGDAHALRDGARPAGPGRRRGSRTPSAPRMPARPRHPGRPSSPARRCVARRSA